MTTIDLSQKPENFPDFYFLRSEAMDAYARVEQSSCNLLTVLLGISPQAGAVVFFSIVNTSARRRMFEDLFAVSYGEQYTFYLSGVPKTPNRKGLLHLLKETNDLRNRIVHWSVEHEVKLVADASQIGNLRLVKPNFWARGESVVNDDDLRDFIRKARFASLSAGCLAHYLLHQRMNVPALQDDPWAAWHRIFQEPCAYPPSAGHPYFMDQ